MVNDTSDKVALRQADACAMYANGYNCAQCVVRAVADLTGRDADILTACTSGFGGGVGRCGDLCGVISGMATALGAACWHIPDDRKDVTVAVAGLYHSFADKFGATCCRDLKTKLHIPCTVLIAEGVRLVTEELERR